MVRGVPIRFDISGKLKEGESVNQVPEMILALLEERFKLTAHRAQTNRHVYALVIANCGLKVSKVFRNRHGQILPRSTTRRLVRQHFSVM